MPPLRRVEAPRCRGYRFIFKLSLFRLTAVTGVVTVWRMDITYMLSVTVTRPVRVYDNDSTADDAAGVAEWMIGRDAQHELEKEVLRALRVIDGDCDCEVMLKPEAK